MIHTIYLHSAELFVWVRWVCVYVCVCCKLVYALYNHKPICILHLICRCLHNTYWNWRLCGWHNVRTIKNAMFSFILILRCTCISFEYSVDIFSGDYTLFQMNKMHASFHQP